MEKIFRMTCAVMLITVLFSVQIFMCYGEVAEDDAEGGIITELQIEEYEEEMYVGDTQNLTVTTYPVDADVSEIQYKSSDSAILSVTKSGKITAYKTGKAKIIISSGKTKETLFITVKEKTDSIRLNAEQISLKPEETYQIEARAYPQKASQSFSYKSTNADVASVSKKGIIYGKKEGHASILVSNDVLTEIIFVIVNRESEPVDFSYEGEEKGKGSAENDEAATVSEILTSEELKKLKETSQYREWQYDGYKICLEGKNVVNPENTFRTQIQFQNEGENIRFIVNRSKPLPGNFQLTLEEPYQSYKYLYLYNENQKKYQKLNYDNCNGVIELSEAGIHILTNELQEKSRISPWFLGGIAIIVLVLGIGYIFVKRKYWFW